MTQAYPLQWPTGYDRTRRPETSRFKLSLADSRDSLLRQIQMLGGTQVVISSNAKLRADSLPYSKQPRIDDTGVAVYFLYRGNQVVLACDKWDSIGDNIRALGLAIEAIRSLERWGVSDMLNRTFEGFKLLPEPTAVFWWEVLEVKTDATMPEITAAYRRLVKTRHPDGGGSDVLFQELKDAYEQAKASPQPLKH